MKAEYLVKNKNSFCFKSFLYYFGITIFHKFIVSNHLVVSHALSVDLRGKILATLRARLQ